MIQNQLIAHFWTYSFFDLNFMSLDWWFETDWNYFKLWTGFIVFDIAFYCTIFRMIRFVIIWSMYVGTQFNVRMKYCLHYKCFFFFFKIIIHCNRCWSQNILTIHSSDVMNSEQNAWPLSIFYLCKYVFICIFTADTI